MVERLKKILKEIEKRNGPVRLFAFLEMDDMADRWTLIISAAWIREANRFKKFKEVMALLRKNFNGEELSSFARVVLMPKEDHLVHELLKKKTGYHITDEKINGNMVQTGEIIKSDATL